MKLLILSINVLIFVSSISNAQINENELPSDTNAIAVMIDSSEATRIAKYLFRPDSTTFFSVDTNSIVAMPIVFKDTLFQIIHKGKKGSSSFRISINLEIFNEKVNIKSREFDVYLSKKNGQILKIVSILEDISKIDAIKVSKIRYDMEHVASQHFFKYIGEPAELPDASILDVIKAAPGKLLKSRYIVMQFVDVQYYDREPQSVWLIDSWGGLTVDYPEPPRNNPHISTDYIRTIIDTKGNFITAGN